MEALSEERMRAGLRVLARRDPDLARVLKLHGPPPFWQRESGFATLVLIILEQQVSLSSARAAYERLLAAASPLTPEQFLRLNADELRAIGFSRQKTTYCRELSACILDGALDVEALESAPDEEVRARLCSVKGIGPWTADIYLLMALRRPDVWPVGDLALVSALQRIKRLRKSPPPERVEKLGSAWRPWRSVAARVLWHYYLSERDARRGAPA